MGSDDDRKSAPAGSTRSGRSRSGAARKKRKRPEVEARLSESMDVPPFRLPLPPSELGLIVRVPGAADRQWNPYQDDFGARVLSVTSELRFVDGRRDRQPVLARKQGDAWILDASVAHQVEVRVGGVRWVFSARGIEAFRGSHTIPIVTLADSDEEDGA